MSKYTPQYFIKFFSEIPDSRWTVLGRHDCCISGIGCALNHAYSYSAEAASALIGFFRRSGFHVVDVNDLSTNPRFPQITPKARILAALTHIEKAQAALDNHKK